MSYNTIKLNAHSKCIEEMTALATIAPGMLVELYSTAGYCRKHSTLHGNAIPMFALERQEFGKEIADTFEAGDKVNVWFPYRGDKVNALLDDGENVARGDFLVSNGDGFLKKYDATGESTEGPMAKIVAVADEAVNRSSSSGVAGGVGRIRVIVA